MDEPTGLSPRMWGTRFKQAGISGIVRFIPTYVGNAGITLNPSSKLAVYPHVCGERSG